MMRKAVNTEFPEPSVSDEAIRWLVRLRSGSFTIDEHAALAAWRAAAPAHERAFQEAESIWRAADGFEQDPVSGMLRAAPDAAAGRLSPGPLTSSGQKAMRTRVLAIAACLAMAMFLGVLAFGGLDGLTSDCSTRTAEVREVQLDDGSTVTLNAGAAVDVHFNSGERRVELRAGRAFFQVVRDTARRPFEVTAGGATVTVLGTAFEVERRLDGSVAVSVSEHTVSVQSQKGDVTTVDEGRSVVVDSSGGVREVDSVTPSRVASWREGSLIADSRTLGEVVAELSNYHHGWMLISDERAARLSVNAVLDLHDPHGSLEVLSAALPIRVRTLTPAVIIISSR